MARLIEDEKLIEELKDFITYGPLDPHHEEPLVCMGFKKLEDVVAHQPTVDAVEVVHGRWIKDGDVVVCSNCGEEHAWAEYRATYCEDCGAKMDGGEKG